MKKNLLLCLTLLTTLLLSGCSGYSKNTLSYPHDLKPISLITSAPYDLTSRAVVQRFKSMGVHISLEEKPEHYVIRVSKDEIEEKILTIGINTRIRQTEITFLFTYQVEAPSGELLMKPRTIKVIRTHIENLDNLLGTYKDKMLLQQEMRHDAVTLLLYQLNSPELTTALARHRQTEYYEN
jgi:outer membrane lipopolysaccharide assembly protein LptE/RlpB